MSHCCYLFYSTSPNPDTEETVAEQENCGAQIPMEWAALFNADDVYSYDASEEEEEEDICSYLSFVTSTEAAEKNLKRRMPSLAKLLSTERVSYCKQLQREILAANEEFIHLNITVVMSTTGKSMGYEAEQWRSILAGLDEEITDVRSGMSKLLRGSGIPSSWKAVQGWSP